MCAHFVMEEAARANERVAVGETGPTSTHGAGSWMTGAASSHGSLRALSRPGATNHNSPRSLPSSAPKTWVRPEEPEAKDQQRGHEPVPIQICAKLHFFCSASKSLVFGEGDLVKTYRTAFKHACCLSGREYCLAPTPSSRVAFLTRRSQVVEQSQRYVRRLFTSANISGTSAPYVSH